VEKQSAAYINNSNRNKHVKIKYVIFICRLILAITFLVSSAGKLVDIERYSVAMVYNFDILPGPFAIIFGWTLPFIELACGITLLFGILTRLSAIGVGLLGISFLVTKVILLSRGTDVECGCFGAIGSTMASWSVYLDPIITLLSIMIIFSSAQNRHWASLANKLSKKRKDKLDLVW